MNKVDNFEHIGNLLEFYDDDTFYIVQVIQRRKENSGMSVGQRTVMTKYINSLDGFLKSKDDLINIAESTNSRVYVNLNAKSYKKTSFAMLTTLGAKLECGDFKTAYIFDKATGLPKTHHPKNQKKWIVDVDESLEIKKYDQLIQHINDDIQPIGDKFIAVIPTLNGFHLITKPFNPQMFKWEGLLSEEPDIHKNNPTILYANCESK
jgi:hypothetical protein